MMIFWLIAGVLAVLVASLVLRSMVRAPQGTALSRGDYDVSVYRAQLADMDRDVARGVVKAEDAERLKTEISRRILSAADETADGTGADGVVPQKAGFVPMIALTLALVAGSLALYLWIGAPGYGDMALQDRFDAAEDLRQNRPSQAEALANMPPPDPTLMPEETRALMQRLRDTVAERPDDLQGHTFLAQYEARVGNYAAAAEAQAGVLRIKGDGASAQDHADYAQLLIIAAGGYVSPEAEIALRRVLAIDEDNGFALYEYGRMTVQTGRPDITLRIWDRLLRAGPPDAPWIEPIQAQIASVAQVVGTRYEIPEVGTGSVRGPTAEDLDMAAEMSPAERMEMIGSMVAGLSDRLATEGGPPQDWARLITSLGVLNERAQALAIYNNALEVFGDDPTALDMIREAGEQAGIAG